MSDIELADLFERRDDLTDSAREALVAEFRERDLDDETSQDSATFISGGDSNALVHLWDFVDGIEASECVRVLEKAEIRAELKPVAQDTTRSDGTPLLVMELYVSEPDEQRAVVLLRRHKGLFPLAERQANTDYEPGDEDWFVVAEFDSAEDAELASRELTARSVPFRMSEEVRDGETVSILQVAQNDVDRAGEAMEHAFRGVAESELDG